MCPLKTKAEGLRRNKSHAGTHWPGAWPSFICQQSQRRRTTPIGQKGLNSLPCCQSAYPRNGQLWQLPSEQTRQRGSMAARTETQARQTALFAVCGRRLLGDALGARGAA